MTDTFFAALTTGQVRHRPRPSAGVADLFRSAARWLAREARLIRDRRHLENAPDHVLKDLGISRSEIGSAVRYGVDRGAPRRRRQ